MFPSLSLSLFYIGQRKQSKKRSLQDPNQSNVDNINNVRCEASRPFRNKEKEYLKAEIDELETNSKFQNIRDLCGGISDFKEGYQPETSIIKDEKGDIIRFQQCFG
jgi:hypothetical protein